MKSTDGKFDTFRAVIHPWQCDVMGHMATRHYSPMFEDASYHLFSMMGVSGERDDGLGWADVRQEYEYLKEVRRGDLLLLQSYPVKLGSKSITYVHEMKDAESDDLKTRVTTISVRFDLKARSAVPIEDEIRQRIEANLLISALSE
ncbi:acyl-CoA thioesterase [Hyphococcus luteus]|nr:thioesterase family protein [Marinicaulis flavus]